MAEYIDIYNKSIGNFLEHFSKKYNLEANKIKEEYTYVYTKKLTGYMLFVKDMYKNNIINNNMLFKNNSKLISQKWKTLDPKIKKEYNDKAKSLNDVFKKPQQTIEKPKKKQKEVIKVEYNTKLDDNILYEIIKDQKTYIIDNFKNIIDINNEEGMYVGYIKDDELYFY